MRIDQTTPARQLPQTAAPPEQNLSNTDWKTHTLVVLSYLLVGVGIALAFCAPYIAFTVQPMLAVASPVLPIALGVLGLQYSSDPVSAAKIAAPVKPSNTALVPPIGIDRERNNCWVNASLQLLFNVTGFRKLLENLDNPSDPLLSKLKSAFDIYKQGGKVISQEIRQLLPELNSEIDPSSQFPDDPILFLDPLLKKLSYPSLKEYGHSIVRKEGEVSSVARLSNNDDQVYIDLGQNYKKDKNKMTEILNNHFDYTVFNKTDDNKVISENLLFFLKEIPDDFSTVIHSSVNEQSGEKEDRVVEEALQVSITDKNRYFCDGFIIHSGSTPNNGHYIAYLNKDGNWWEANDSVIKLIDPETAERLIKTAYLRHYQKVPTTQALT